MPRDAILELQPIVRSVIEGRVRERGMIDDLTQEVMTRLLEAQGRLDRTTLASYAVVTARNLAISHERGRDLEERHAHRLVDADEPPRPEEEALRAEDRAAMAAALRRLSEEEREALMAHELAGVDTRRLARQLKTTPGGAAMRLARARAKLRVEYLIAATQVRLPTAKCRSVLVAISAGDKRRQAALDAADHILQCPACSQLSDDLLHRRRPLAVVIPMIAVHKLREGLRTTRGKVATATAVGAVAVAVAIALAGSPPKEPRRTPAVVVQGRVIAVPSDEGFWVRTKDGRRVWVEIAVPTESAPEVDPGEAVRVRGRREPHDSRYAARMGVTPAEGAARLTRLGWHVVASEGDLDIDPRDS